MSDATADKGPDLSRGVPLDALAEGRILLGHVGDDAVLLTRSGGEIFALGATCTHYNGPLAEGLIVGDTVRCPLHHACFSLRTGEALRAPALDPVAAWQIVERDGNIHVTEKLTPPPKPELKGPDVPASVLIIGGGAAGNAAAEMLRREGYAGPVTLLSADDSVPVDRPNLSKDYLAGQAEESWIPLRSAKFYEKHGINLVLNARIVAIDPAAKTVRREDGTLHSYDGLLLATGADPVHLNIPGAERVHYLRTLDDSRAIIAAAEKAKRAVIIGASFIGLEAAASLRERGLDVHVVGPEARPLEKILGPEIGDFVRALHESHGVTFHLGTSATAIDERGVTLGNGVTLPADLNRRRGRRAARGRARAGCGAEDRSRHRRQRISRNQRAGHFRGRRSGALARPVERTDHPCRALGRGGAAGPGRGAQYPRPAPTLRPCALLLEPALRRLHPLCRACRKVGSDDNRGRPGSEELPGELFQQWAEAGGRGDRPGP
ncbi:Rieske-like 2Fe-2S protein [Methylovirgula ligni]|uniref:Rieske-like 2Fe-2S protein n=1 Tax=Methylovirgula ligni TaxID=569860 RepID=A0A3D9ZC31_9HYPH|nr:Rieske-like 2Fe-2S protein [Methylovirgula ligni]